MTAAATFTVWVQDEGSFEAIEYVVEASLEGAQMGVEELVAEMDAVPAGEITLAQARADLDLDGEIVRAAWFAIKGQEARSLVAIIRD